MFQYSKNKAPSPGGFNFAFFHKCKKMVKEKLFKVFCKFFNDAIVNKRTNATFTCLNSKKDNALRVNDFMPISLITNF